MTKSYYVVLTNAVGDRHLEFNEWYNNQHIPDLLRTPGVLGAQRYRLCETQRDKPPYPYQYLAIYECDADRLEEIVADISRRVGTPDMPLSEAYDSSHRIACFFEPLTGMIRPGDPTPGNQGRTVARSDG
jgi:hypothetical protein